MASAAQHRSGSLRVLPIALALVAHAAPVAAQSAASRFTFRIEGGVGSMFSSAQRERLGYDVAVQGTARVGVTLAGPVAFQVSASDWWFFSNLRNGQVVMVGGGPRLDTSVGSVGQFVADVNAGAALTGPDLRVMLDVGMGFEFALGPAASIGPVVRYGRVFTAPSDEPSDAQFWSGGISLALRVPPSTPRAPAVEAPQLLGPGPASTQPSADGDGDGVLDVDDPCPTAPSGAQPDPTRRGCPLEDTDGDGVDDGHDACPTAAPGAHPDPEREGCPVSDPDGDADHDGVRNRSDRCRDEPDGRHPDPRRPGCPAIDSDDDTLLDPVDACPDVPGAPSTNPRRNGCPGVVSVEYGQLRLARPLLFAPGRHGRLLRQSYDGLRALADVLEAAPQIRRVSIDAYTDGVGSEPENIALTTYRAASVLRYLVSQGVDRSRLEAHGEGSSHPLETDRTREGRAANRRIEFHIVETTQPGAGAPR